MIPVRVIGRSSNMFLEKHHPTFRFFRQNEVMIASFDVMTANNPSWISIEAARFVPMTLDLVEIREDWKSNGDSSISCLPRSLVVVVIASLTCEGFYR
ncbi:uncharacterized protein LOC122056965 isoform X4 [Macadamia integrifolia]|uniref:uncharacterized protein LOC122056965 isoform X4 n=1 Tax=Macadamia integrifolia TaxID=60698 RepID=UPI001C529CEF|nr:uncharacterized protein LOC122056965 isoform X4 [Macadamia integrifolia]